MDRFEIRKGEAPVGSEAVAYHFLLNENNPSSKTVAQGRLRVTNQRVCFTEHLTGSLDMDINLDKVTFSARTTSLILHTKSGKQYKFTGQKIRKIRKMLLSLAVEEQEAPKGFPIGKILMSALLVFVIACVAIFIISIVLY